MASSRDQVQVKVDRHFFDNTFEPMRKKLQEQLGVRNLSQAKFTKMIKGLKLKLKPLKGLNRGNGKFRI